MWSVEYYKKKLSSRDQRIYDAIVDHWMNLEDRIMLKRSGAVTPDYSEITSAIQMDHPEIFWVNYFEGISISSQSWPSFGFSKDVTDTISSPFFFQNKNEIRDLRKELQEWQRKVLHAVPRDRDDRNKLWLLYNYLSSGMTYREGGYLQSHTIYGCFRKNQHESVCQGISMGMKFLAESLGIPCIVVHGDYSSPYHPDIQGPHAWNIFSIGDQFRHLDTTAELQYAQMLGSAREKNVAMTDDEAAREGYCWNRSEVPACRRT